MCVLNGTTVQCDTSAPICSYAVDCQTREKHKRSRIISILFFSARNLISHHHFSFCGQHATIEQIHRVVVVDTINMAHLHFLTYLRHSIKFGTLDFFIN